MFQNVRIHLDEVARLGTFLEFEAVLGQGVDDAVGNSQIVHLSEVFKIAPTDLLTGSYSDMIGDAQNAALS